MKILFPDCLWTPNKLSGAAFLYLHDDVIGTTLHPSVSTVLTGVDPFDILPLIKTRQPLWAKSFHQFLHIWANFRNGLITTSQLLKPLLETGTKSVWPIYDRSSHAWERSKQLLEVAALPKEQVHSMVDWSHASDELFSHIFFDKVLQIQRHGMNPEEISQASQKVATAVKSGTYPVCDFDWGPIYDYCDSLFGHHSLDNLLARAYLFRVSSSGPQGAILLTNPKLISFLVSLPDKYGSSQLWREDVVDEDVTAWEFFRQLLSPHLDPLNSAKVSTVQKMIMHRKSEIARLKNTCWQLANVLGSEKNVNNLVLRVRDHIKMNVSTELNDLLQLDKEVFKRYLENVFSDQRAWAALLGMACGGFGGSEIITAGSALYALSNLGSKAVGQLAERRETLRSSPYTLIYRASH